MVLRGLFTDLCSIFNFHASHDLNMLFAKVGKVETLTLQYLENVCVLDYTVISDKDTRHTEWSSKRMKR